MTYVTFRLDENIVGLHPYIIIVSMETKDSNGNVLNTGDSVHLVKDLKVKGSSQTLKRGVKIKGIQLTENPAEVECKIEGSWMVLKTEFLKKA